MIESTRAILGIPTSVASDSAAVIDVAERAFQAWPATDDPPQVRIRIDVAPDRTRAAGT